MGSSLQSLWLSAGGKIPEGWDIVSLEDLLISPKSITVGVMYPGKHYEDGVPLVKVSDVKKGQILKKPDFYISESVDEEYSRTRLFGDELLITLVGNPGDCVVVNNKMVGWNVARALAVLRLKNPDLRNWLKLILLSSPSKHLIDSRLNTTVQKTLNLKDIKELPIPFPPTVIRQKLCEVESCLQDKIELNRQTNQTLEKMAQALFKSWFVDFDLVIDNALATGKSISDFPEPLQKRAELRKTVQQSTDAIKLPEDIRTLFPSGFEESELGWVPKGWEVCPLSDLISVKHGYAFKGEFFSDVVTQQVLLTPGNVAIGGGFKGDKFKYYNGLIMDDYVFETDDMYITMTDLSKAGDTLGYPALVPNVDGHTFHHNQRLGKVNYKNKKQFGSGFIYQCLCSIDYRNHIIASATGTTVKHTSPTKVLMHKILISGGVIEEQFDIFVKEFTTKMNLNKSNSRSLSKVRDLLLPKLISGELPIN